MARLKHVLPNPAHLWAHQTYAGTGENHARNQRDTFWFNGVSVYSYRTEMGRIVENAKGQKAYVLNNGSYGSCTSGHQGDIRGAVRGLDLPVFYVASRNPSWGDSALAEIVRDPKAYVQVLFARAAELQAKAQKARTRGDWYLANAAEQIEKARAWVAFWGIKGVKFPRDLDALAKSINKAKAAEAKRERAVAKQARKDAQEQIDKWCAGENVRIPYSVTEAFMRLSPDGTVVQTSMGADVPADHVRRAAALVTRMVRSGQSYAGVPPIRFGHYSVSSIDAQGNVRVGCHYFTRAEIERFYEVLKSQGGVRDEVVA